LSAQYPRSLHDALPIWARVAGAGGGLIAVGGVLVLVGGAVSFPVLLLGGFALAGFGCATLVPSAFAAAAALPGVSDGAGVTLVGDRKSTRLNSSHVKIS